VVLYEHGFKTSYLLGIDNHNVFSHSTIPYAQERAFFLWCFNQPDDYKCIYTPREFSCDWVEWNENVYPPFKDGGQWAPMDIGKSVTSSLFTLCTPLLFFFHIFVVPKFY
jgi:hypothetical protein